MNADNIAQVMIAAFTAVVITAALLMGFSVAHAAIDKWDGKITVYSQSNVHGENIGGAVDTFSQRD